MPLPLTLKDRDQEPDGGADNAHLALGRARRIAAVVETDSFAVLERRQVRLVIAVELVVAVELLGVASGTAIRVVLIDDPQVR